MTNYYYHNPRCSKSRQGLTLIQHAGVSVEIKDYLKDGLTDDEIVGLCKKLSMHPSEFIRKNEPVYKTLGGEDFSIEEWADIIKNNPILLQRPILVIGQTAVIGRPPEALLSIL